MVDEHTYQERAMPTARWRSGRLVCLMMAMAMAFVAGCGALPARDDQGPEVALSFEKYTLGNGLEVILRKDDQTPTAAVNLWYHVGPANEVKGRTGFAHLFEHMMFTGTGHVASGVSDKLLEAAGVTGSNATTSLDRTNYFDNVPPDALELALWLRSDQMGFLLDSLDQAQLSNQQRVVRNERRETTEGPPYALSYQAMIHELFPPDHPYHANIIGSHEDIQAAKLDDVRDFFNKYYVPNNASLAIVGNVDIAATKAMIEKYFGSIPRGADVPAPQVATPRLTQERRLTVTDQVELPAVTMAWVTSPIYTPGDAEAGVVASVLGVGKTSRLYETLVHRTGIAQGVSASQRSLSYGSMFTISATAKPGHTADELEAAIQRELDALAADGPTPAELKAVTNGLRAGAVFGLESPAGVADLLNQYNHYLGDPGYLNRDLRRYAAIDTQAVKRFVTEQLPSDRRVVVRTVPGVKVLPPDPPAPPAAAEPEVERAPSAEPWRNTAPELGPTPAMSLPSAQRFELDNGLPVYLVESHGLPLTVASLVSRWGSATDPSGQPGLASFAAGMLEEGTQSRDALGIARELEGLGAWLSTSAGSDSSSISVGSLAPQMGAAMAVMADVARAPAFPPAEIELMRGRSLVALEQGLDDPSTVASGVLSHELYGELHPDGPTMADLKKALRAISREDLQRFHQAAFTPRNSALVLAGDLTKEQARTLANHHFGSWSGAGVEPPPPGPPVPSAQRVIVVDKPGSGQTALELGQPGVALNHPDYEKLRVLDALLGGGFSSRVNLNLRERHGYTYGASSTLNSGRRDGHIALQTSAKAEFTGASVRELLNEVAALQNAPVSAEELRRAKGSLSRSIPAGFATVSARAGIVGGLYAADLPPDYYQKLPAVLAAVDAEAVQAAARAHLRPAEMKVVAVGDRARIDAQLAELGLGPIAYRNPDGAPATE
ncbi:MAG TPA: pitrilysin family protein [Pseudonocardia sp.]|uniref:M16 family metallopeptidase n=1 Tax=Pseudonocardia sp. TaxID=60912 RepID=UPI002B8BF42C|nr:pitrilysin family protein [Pseudonocardia sp.]HTF46252.1 pitrilysin family protein [Pseudonocardia sp.]